MPTFFEDGPNITEVVGLANRVLGSPSLSVQGPLASLYQNQRAISKFQYPLNLGQGPYVHWIQFNILRSTGLAGAPEGGFGGVANQNGFSSLGNISGSITSGIKSLTGFDASSFISPGRRVRSLGESIALYIPNQVVFNQNNNYSDVSLTQQLGLAAQLAQGASGASQGQGAAAPIGEAGAGALNMDPNMVLYATSGVALNPQFEVIFQQTDLRTFQFEFVLTATSPEEADAIVGIINTFRKAAAPEIAGFDGRYLVPPDEFDISFYFNGGNLGDQKIIPKLSTCVLQSVITDFAPTGAWSTFADGRPVATRLTLQFKEVELIHKALIDKGF